MENIETAYDKINRNKIKQLDNMGILGRRMEFIRELINNSWINVRVGGYISHNKQTNLGIPQGEVLSVNLFLLAINDIQGELLNKKDESLFADDLAIYITTRI